MKKVFALIMSVCMIVPMLTGCVRIPVPETITEKIAGGIKEVIEEVGGDISEKMENATISITNYLDEEKYTVGGGEIAEAATEIEINWVFGSVKLIPDDVAHITLEEESEKTITDDLKLRYLAGNGKVTVQYCKPIRIQKADAPEKVLTVRIPRNLDLKKVTINGVDVDIVLGTLSVDSMLINMVNGEIRTEDGQISAEEIKIDGVNCTINLQGTITKEIDIDIVNGDAVLTLPDQGYHLDVDTVGKEYEETVKAGDQQPTLEIDFDAVNGSIEIK